jgi:hypothetical protein
MVIRESMQDQLVSLYLFKDTHPEEKVISDIKNGTKRAYF